MQTERIAASMGKRRWSKREIALAVLAALALIAAIIGFALYGSSLVPKDAAAKVGDSFLAEERVAAQIAQYRFAYQLEDDTDFANALLSQNLNVGSFRQNIINQLALSDLIDKRAKELGIEPATAEAQAQLETMKQTMAFANEEIWAETLASYGLSEELLLTQYLTNLAQQAVFAADVPYREPTEAELVAYIQTYLANTTQKHASRILFTGEDVVARAQECYEQLQAAAESDGSISAEQFATFVKEYSDEEGAGSSSGSFAWTGSGELSEDDTTILEGLAVGSFALPQSTGADDTLEILYCDAEFSFPAADAITSLAELSIPQSLSELIQSATVEELWTQDCNAYLATLILDAKISYYPAPDNAPYAVNMALASLEASSEEGDE